MSLLLSFSVWGRVGIGILLANVLIAVIGPFIAPVPPGEILSFQSFAPPGTVELLGTDYLGRDLYYGGWAVLLPAGAIALLVIGINLLVDSFVARARGDVSKAMLK